MPLNCTWSFLFTLCTGLLFFPNWWGSVFKTKNSTQFFQHCSHPLNNCYFCKDCFMLIFSACLMLLPLMLVLYCSPLPSLAGCFSSPQSQPELSRNAMPPINLERWYQDIMAAGEPQSCPPPLPAKSFSTRRHSQVNSPLFSLCIKLQGTNSRPDALPTHYLPPLIFTLSIFL